MVGEQLKYVVCNWMLHIMEYEIILIVHLLIVLRLSINEICSSALKFMKIDTTAVCVKTLDQHHVCEVLVQHGQCEAVYYKADYKERDIVTGLGVRKRKWASQTHTAMSMYFIGEKKIRQRSLRFKNSQRFPHELKTRSNTERDSLFATYSPEERFNLFWLITQRIQSLIGSNEDGIEGGVEFVPEPVHTWSYRNLLKSNTLLKNYMIVSNQDDIKERFKFETELFNFWKYRGPITDKFSSLVLYQDILQTRTCKNWVMNSLKADKRITMKFEKEADRKGMSEKHVAILAYCDYVNRCISHHELMIPKEEALSLQRLTQSGPVSMKINGELRKEEYNLFTSSTKCQLCVDRNKAVNWCNTCEKNICDFCKVFHQKVWDVMDHDILPLRIAY